MKKLTTRSILVLAAVLVATLVTPASAEPLPTVMSIACVDGKTQVDTTTIAPQGDGFHFLITKAGAAGGIRVWRASGRGYGGFEFGDAPREISYAAAPGDYIIACSAGHIGDEVPPSAVAVSLSDPDGIYHRAYLDCATRKADGAGPPASDTETPEEAIARLVTGIQGTDVVEYTKYPDFDYYRFYRVMRGDKVVARLSAVRWPPDDPQANWGISGLACRASGIR